MKAYTGDEITLSGGGSGHHIGVQYRIGLPQILNPLLAQKDVFDEKIWCRSTTLAHHVGLFYGSPSLANNFPLTIGVGIEYGKINFKARIGNLADTVFNAVDADNDTYTAFLSYSITECASLHYVSVPLTLSLGQPRQDRISGYGQLTLAPSVCVAQNLIYSGTYNHHGHYSQLSGNEVDLYLDDMASLGFGNGFNINEVQKEVSLNRFVLMGRLAAGFYVPLCKTYNGNTSPCVFKVGVSMDFSLTSIAKDIGSDESMPEATYRLRQFNLLNGKGCRFVNPALEVGLIYILAKK